MSGFAETHRLRWPAGGWAGVSVSLQPYGTTIWQGPRLLDEAVHHRLFGATQRSCPQLGEETVGTRWEGAWWLGRWSYPTYIGSGAPAKGASRETSCPILELVVVRPQGQHHRRRWAASLLTLCPASTRPRTTFWFTSRKWSWSRPHGPLISMLNWSPGLVLNCQGSAFSETANSSLGAHQQWSKVHRTFDRTLRW